MKEISTNTRKNKIKTEKTEKDKENDVETSAETRHFKVGLKLNKD